MSLINNLVNKLLLLYVNLDAKIMIFLSLQVVFTKKGGRSLLFFVVQCK